MNESSYEAGRSIWSRAYEALTTPVFTLGDASLSAANILKFLLFVVILVWSGLAVRRALRRRVLPSIQVEASVAETLSNLVGYAVIVEGLLIGLQTIGVKLAVSHIKIRATEVLTNDNIAVIVPNSEFISSRVINWSRGGTGSGSGSASRWRTEATWRA